MTTIDFITELFCRINDQMKNIKKHPQALKGVGTGFGSLNVHNSSFHPVVELFKAESVIFSDTGFHSTSGDPENLKCCKRGQWNDRMLIETVFSMLTIVCHFKKVLHRVEDYFQSRLAFTIAAFNLLIQWEDWQPDDHGFVPISIAEFSL